MCLFSGENTYRDKKNIYEMIKNWNCIGFHLFDKFIHLQKIRKLSEEKNPDSLLSQICPYMEEWPTATIKELLFVLGFFTFWSGVGLCYIVIIPVLVYTWRNDQSYWLTNDLVSDL